MSAYSFNPPSEVAAELDKFFQGLGMIANISTILKKGQAFYFHVDAEEWKTAYPADKQLQHVRARVRPFGLTCMHDSENRRLVFRLWRGLEMGTVIAPLSEDDVCEHCKYPVKAHPLEDVTFAHRMLCDGRAVRR